MPGLIGSTSDTGTALTSGANTKLAYRVQAVSSFTVQTMSFAAAGGFGPGEYVKLGIYSDNSGEPDALLATSEEVEGTGESSEWYSADLVSPLSVTSGTYYWLAFIADAAIQYVCETATNIGRYNSDTYSDGFADPFGSTTTSNDELGLFGTDAFHLFGDLDSGGAVVETSGGTKYAVLETASVIEVWKNIDSTTASLEDSNTEGIVHEGGAPVAVHAAIDSSDNIHIVSAANYDSTREIAYAIYDTGTDTIGTWEEAAAYTEGPPSSLANVKISIDSSDKPHIVYIDLVASKGSTQTNVYYTNKTGASWSVPDQIGVRATKTDFYRLPDLSHAPAGDLEVFYHGYILNGVGAWKILHRRRNSVWGTETSWSLSSDGSEGVGVAVTTGDVVYRAMRVGAGDIYESDSDTGYNAGTTYKSNISLALDGTTRYIFYVDLTGNDVYVISNDGGGWTDEGVQNAGTYENVIAEWAYNNENQSGEINYIFTDGTNVYYDSFALAGTINFSATLASTSSTPGTGVLAVSREMAATLASASTTPDTPVLAVVRELAAVLASATTTPDTATLDKVVSFLATLASATTTPDTPTLALGLEFLAALAPVTTTPVTAVLGVSYEMAATLASATTTPDAAVLALSLEFLAALDSATTTPDTVVLGLAYELVATAASATTTPEIVTLAVSRALDAIAASATTTPDTVVLTVAGIIEFAATLAALTTTPDTASMAISRAMAAVLASATTTPDTVVLSVADIIEFAATLASSTTTPDTVIFAVVRDLLATLAASTTTPDTVALALSKAMSAVLASATTTPDTAALAVVRELAATLAASTTTPDTVVLSMAGIIEFAATLAATTTTPDAALALVLEFAATLASSTTTPDTVTLAVVRDLLATLAASTTTPDTAAMTVVREFLATLAAATTAPDTASMAVSRAMAAVLASATTTPDSAVLSMAGIIEFLATLAASTTTPDTAGLAVVRELAATLAAATTTPDARLGIPREFAATLAAVTTTPDAAVLAIVVKFLATLAASTTTPDTAVLAVARVLLATLAASSTTPDTAAIAVLRELTATLAAVSTTPDATLAVVREFLATLAAATTSPDDVDLTISIGGDLFLAAVLAAETTTPTIPWGLARGAGGLVGLDVQVPEDYMIMFGDFGAVQLH